MVLVRNITEVAVLTMDWVVTATAITVKVVVCVTVTTRVTNSVE